MTAPLFSLKNRSKERQVSFKDIVDVKHVSMLMARMESGALISYQQCHFTPDDRLSYTVIGSRGSIESFSNSENRVIRLRTDRSPYDEKRNREIVVQDGDEDADSLAVADFLRFARTGAPTKTSPLDAWQAVATVIQATDSLRDESQSRHIPSLPTKLVEYFSNNQKN